jgi:serine O-acetyltransferase
VIGADIYRCRGRQGIAAGAGLLLVSRPFRAVFTLRLYQRLARSGAGRWLSPLAAVAHRWACGAAAMDIPLRTSIGPGFKIAHGWGIVINAHARIGRNVTLFHGVTIGQADRIAPDGSRITRYPVLEDNVWVGPGAAILGGVVIGEGSRILAGAIVTTDIPPRSLVSGNPAVVIRSDCVPDVDNAWDAGLADIVGSR